MTGLSAAALRRLARSRGLELADGDLDRLRPMVEDLLAAAGHLRESLPEPLGVEQPSRPEAPG